MTKPWKDFRQEITRLYIHDGMTLAQVRAIMKEHHNFDASWVIIAPNSAGQG